MTNTRFGCWGTIGGAGKRLSARAAMTTRRKPSTTMTSIAGRYTASKALLVDLKRAPLIDLNMLLSSDVRQGGKEPSKDPPHSHHESPQLISHTSIPLVWAQ